MDEKQSEVQLPLPATVRKSGSRRQSNLLTCEEIATVCIDPTFRVKWFTAAAGRLFKLMPEDLGRSIIDLRLMASDPLLLEQAKGVFISHDPRIMEIKHQDGVLRRIARYRSTGGRTASVVVTYTDVTETKQAERHELYAKFSASLELARRGRERAEELRRLSRAVSVAEVRERQEMAQELYDGLGHGVNVAMLKIDALRKSAEASSIEPALDELKDLLDGFAQEIGALTAKLSPPVLWQLGLAPALEWLGEEMRKSYHLTVEISAESVPRSLDCVITSVLFKSARELLIGVAQHARVKVAKITTRVTHDTLTVEVCEKCPSTEHTDNQLNFRSGEAFATIQERIAYVGGSLRIEPDANQGTTAVIQVPINSQVM